MQYIPLIPSKTYNVFDNSGTYWGVCGKAAELIKQGITPCGINPDEWGFIIQSFGENVYVAWETESALKAFLQGTERLKETTGVTMPEVYSAFKAMGQNYMHK